jgi:hypothetical protein
MTEVDDAGHDLLDLSAPTTNSYRAIKVPVSQLDLDFMHATAGK